MIRDRSDQMFLAELYRRVWNASLAFEAIKAAHHFFIPPWPFLKIKDAMMKHHDAFAAFHEVAQVLLPFVIKIAGKIVKNQDIVLGANVLLKSELAVGNRRPAEVVIGVE